MTLLAPPQNCPDTALGRPRHRFTREEVAHGVDVGWLPASGYELIEGDILDKMGKNFPHILVTQFVLLYLQGVFGSFFVVSQEPIVLSDDSEPEPDVAVLAQPLPTYQDKGFLSVADVRLIVEVSDATLAYDRTTKARLYARANVAEYWVIDVPGRQVWVHRFPFGDEYGQITRVSETEMIAPLAAPQSSTRVADLLPPVTP